MTPPIPQLLFSTRAAHPEGGLEFNRELVACTPELEPDVRGFFNLRADLTYSTSRQPKLAPVLTFSRIGTGRWLFTRAISLGRYRKSSHHMLVHGLVLEPAHLEALAGNPFLLCRLGGVELAGEHPGSRRDLPALELPEGVERIAGEANRERLESLGSALPPEYRESFAALLELARASAGPVACVTPGQPDAGLIEALLLHFHPADRPELSFHSWYVQDRRLDYRLLFASPAELPLLRRHFPGLEVWTPQARGRHPVAELTRELGKRSPADLAATLETFRIVYFRDEPVPAIDPEDARLCLRHGLGKALTTEEAARCRHLARRSGNPLIFYTGDLHAAWARGHRAFAEEAARHLNRLSAISQPMLESALAELEGSLPEVPAVSDWIPRWALLVMWRQLAEHAPVRDRGVGAWRRLVPLAHFESLAEAVLGTGDEATAVLDDYVTLDAEALAGTASERQPYWPRYLPLLARSGHGLRAMAPRIEAVIETAATTSQALTWLRQLEGIYRQADLPLVANRLVLQRELDLLEPEARSARIRQILGSLLEDPTGGSDKVLRTLLGKQHPAGDLWPAMADWILGQPSPEPAWRRWRLLIENQGEVLEIDTTLACGRFLSWLAMTPLAARIGDSCQALVAARAPAVPEVFFLSRLLEPPARRLLIELDRPPRPETAVYLARSVIGLVSTRARCGEAARGLDQLLLDLLFFSLLHARDFCRRIEAGELAAEGDLDPRQLVAELRSAVETYLDHLLRREGSHFDDLVETDLDDEQLPRVARRREWGHLLMDDLIHLPPARGLDDPRYRACLELALQEWRDAAALDDAGMIRILRLLHMAPRADGEDFARVERIVHRLVPAERRRHARAMLAAWGPPGTTRDLPHEVLPQL